MEYWEFFAADENWAEVPSSLFATQYSDFTCLCISSSFFSKVFSDTPR